MTAAQLNAVAQVLVANGVEPSKELVFSVCLKTLVEDGMPACDAFEVVFGEGSFKKFAGDVYDALRAKAA